MKWQEGHLPDTFLTFFGEDKLFEELEKSPAPPIYFKKFRGKQYTEVIKFLGEELPAWFF